MPVLVSLNDLHTVTLRAVTIRPSVLAASGDGRALIAVGAILRHGYVRRAMKYAEAIRVIGQRACENRTLSRARWAASSGVEAADIWAARMRIAGRLTVNFHPDRIGRDGRSVAAGLLAHRAYQSQWVTGISAGSRSALHGGERHRFEREFFDGAYYCLGSVRPLVRPGRRERAGWVDEVRGSA